MKRVACLAVLMLVASLAGPAQAQLPFPAHRAPTWVRRNAARTT